MDKLITRLMRLNALALIFVTSCKATMPKTGFLDYADRYPNTQALVASNFSLFTTAKALRSVKIHGTRVFGRGPAFTFGAIAWLYTYDLCVNGINQRIGRWGRNVAHNKPWLHIKEETVVVGTLGLGATLVASLLCPPLGVATVALTGTAATVYCEQS